MVSFKANQQPNPYQSQLLPSNAKEFSACSSGEEVQTHANHVNFSHHGLAKRANFDWSGLGMCGQSSVQSLADQITGAWPTQLSG